MTIRNNPGKHDPVVQSLNSHSGLVEVTKHRLLLDVTTLIFGLAPSKNSSEEALNFKHSKPKRGAGQEGRQ
jgi:hypothetical protein